MPQAAPRGLRLPSAGLFGQRGMRKGLSNLWLLRPLHPSQNGLLAFFGLTPS